MSDDNDTPARITIADAKPGTWLQDRDGYAWIRLADGACVYPKQPVANMIEEYVRTLADAEAGPFTPIPGPPSARWAAADFRARLGFQGAQVDEMLGRIPWDDATGVKVHGAVRGLLRCLVSRIADHEDAAKRDRVALESLRLEASGRRVEFVHALRGIRAFCARVGNACGPECRPDKGDPTPAKVAAQAQRLATRIGALLGDGCTFAEITEAMESLADLDPEGGL